MKTIGIIGGGNMGEALIKGLHSSRKLWVAEASLDRARFLKKKYKLSIADIDRTVKESDVLIFAVKPQDMSGVLDQVKASTVRGKLLISIAAGLTTKFFENFFDGRKVAVVRCMPNIPALIAEGITAICAGRYASASDVKTAQHILNTVGQTVIIKELMMDALTAVSGSGPAYVFLFVEQWIGAAKKLGFKEAQAKQLVYRTLLGSAHLLEKSESDPATLRAKVTSKGGTTAAALDVFARGKFDQMMKEVLSAARNRAKQLAK